jgi:general secretion pathway protein G
MKKGFTLIELLVVISVIGILVSLALVSFSSSQKQARDVGRKSDLKQYQTALEVFANKTAVFTYPSRTVKIDVSNLCATLGISGSCPTDPKAPDSVYRYLSDGTGSPNNDASRYVLWATLEGVSGYWVVCPNGKVGQITGEPTSSACPL